MKLQYVAFEIGIKMKKLMKKIEHVQNVLEDDDITIAQERVIFPLFRDERGYTIQELATMGGFAKSLVSRTITDLESKGYVRRDKVSENQDRNIKIVLTEKGKQFVEKKNERVLEVLYKWFANIPPETVQEFSSMLDVLLETDIGEAE
ncbi:MAG: MarR family transcriptional regulator [Firmicutes bacterium]|nr:MarR family transcriptional regulator [Bacillota bacterium]